MYMRVKCPTVNNAGWWLKPQTEPIVSFACEFWRFEMTENTSFTNTSQDTEQADDAARGPDMFARATEVAAAARDVRMMAEHAHRKARWSICLSMKHVSWTNVYTYL